MATGPSRFRWRDGRRPPSDPDGAARHLDGLADLGLDRVVDVHTHWFPERLMQSIWRYFDEHYWPVVYRTSEQERLRALERHAVRAFTTLCYAHVPGLAIELNRWVSEHAATLPGAIPFGTFYPEPEVASYLREAIERLGMRGFKLHCSVSRVAADDPALAPAWEVLAETRLPTVVHCGSAPDPGPGTHPTGLARLLARHPELTVVVAHLGAPETETYVELAERYPNVYLDTTMTLVDFRIGPEPSERLLERIGALDGRVLFGSDFPNVPYDLPHAVESILRLPFAPSVRRGILHDNAARLLGLDGVSRPRPAR